ncbi:MAG: ATP-binding protein [Woeseiaceae bacterium]|nr:ATP-binding protein [Woeseiaceae bacterium]
MLKRLSRSLSFRLLVIFLTLAASFVYFAIAALQWVYSTDELRDLVSGHLSLHIEYVLDDIGDPPRTERAIAITEKVPVDIRIVGPAINWASDDDFPQLSELSFGAGKVISDTAGSWLGTLEGASFAELDQRRYLRIGRGDHSIIVSTPRISDPVTRRSLTPIIVGIGLSLVLLAYLAVRWLFRPVAAIRHGAELIGQGHFDHRITDVRQDQLGDLASDINTMAADVQGMLDAKRQLLLGISHELRSPLSRMRLAIELMDTPDASSDSSGDAAGMRSDVAEMERVIVTLIEAERLNSRHATLHRTECNLRHLVANLIDNFFERDRERIEIEFTGMQRPVEIDEARIILLLKNLLSNALRYSTDDARSVRLSVEVLLHELVLAVQDRGPGIPAAQREFIGEPFFRGDPSRTRQTGGSGLGLYLATLVAKAHGGSLTLDQEYLDGARFVVRLPG